MGAFFYLLGEQAMIATKTNNTSIPNVFESNGIILKLCTHSLYLVKKTPREGRFCLPL